MTLNIQLNLRNKTEGQTEAAERVKAAGKRKAAATETIEEAWTRILSMKNSDSDQAKLYEVKTAMDAGLIGREPASAAKRFSKAEALRLYAILQETERQRKLQDLVDNKPDNYFLLTDDDAVQALNVAVEREDVVAFDVETTGTDIFSDEIIGISFTLPSVDKHYYVALQPMDDPRALPIESLQLLKPCLENQNIKKVAHNGTFDIAILQNYGIEVANLWHDTMTAMFLLNENEREAGGNYQLKSLVPKYLQKSADTFGTLFGKEKDFTKIPLDPFYIYGCKDTHVTWEFCKFQREHLAKLPNVLNYLYDVEMPLLRLNLKMERQGFELDLDFAKKYGEQLHAIASDAEKFVIAECAKFYVGDSSEINLNSTKQMLPVLSEAVGQKLANLDAKRTLKPLRKTHKVIDAFLTYKEQTKMSGTYIEGLPQKIHPKTGRLHSRFDSNGTVTGRYSSGKDKDGESGGDRTNIQNQPYEARKMFKVPKGRLWISADFKSQEIVVAGSLSDEPVIINAFANGLDNYAMMASKAFKKPYDECYKLPDGSDTKYRKDMKVIYLAKMYGMGIGSLANLLGTSKDEAKKFSESFDEGLPELVKWINANTEFVKRYGFVWIGREQRKRRLPKAREKTHNIPWGKYWDDVYKEKRLHNAEVNKSVRQATNARVQGEAAIMTKVTMLEMDEYLDTIGGFIVAPIHDEIVMETDETITKQQIAKIKDVMVNSYTFEKIKNGTDLEFFFERWGEGVAEKDLIFDEFDRLDKAATLRNVARYREDD